MCSPTFALIGLQVASGVVQSQNQIAAGNAQNAYYQYLAKQNESQADLVQRTGQAQSRIIQDVAKVRGKAFSEDAAKLRASQKAALASSGVTGVTAEDLASDTFRTQRLDESALRFNADVQSYEATEGAKSQAFSLKSQAEGFRFAGANAKSAAKRNAFSTLLGTAVSVFNPFSFFQPRTAVYS
jgi:hypothetical protein